MHTIKASGLLGLCGGVSSSLGGIVLLLCLVLQAGSRSAAAEDATPTGSIVGWGSQVVGVDLSSGFESVAGGGLHSLGLKTDGSIVACGDNWFGQCDVPPPNTGFVAVAGGYFHSLGLKADGSIVAWGRNNYGQCDVPSPNMGFLAVAAGRYHSLGLKADGSIVAWGWNDDGQCDVPSPNTGFVSVAAGYGHSLGLKTGGSIVAWGNSYYGQCDVPSPNTGFVSVAAGWSHSLGLRDDGSIVAWGAGQPGQSGWPHYGQCDVPSPNTGFVAVAGAYYHSLGLKDDGSVVPWGSNSFGQCDVPLPNTDFTAVAAGWYHSLGIRAYVITAWRSVRFHGAADALAIELDPGAPGSDVVSEPRRYGIQRIEVDFNVDVTGRLSGTIEAENLNFPPAACPTTSQTLINDGQTLVIEFADCLPGSEAGLADEICYRIDLTDNVMGLTGDTDSLIVGLQGDTNDDHNTNLIDMAQTKSKNGSPVVGDDIRFDVNVDGNVNLIDMALVKSLNGNSATCP